MLKTNPAIQAKFVESERDISPIQKRKRKQKPPDIPLKYISSSPDSAGHKLRSFTLNNKSTSNLHNRHTSRQSSLVGAKTKSPPRKQLAWHLTANTVVGRLEQNETMKYGSADTVVGRLDLKEDEVVESLNGSTKRVFYQDSSPLDSGPRLSSVRQSANY